MATPISARYVHTNLVARDWRRLAHFYQELFDCKPVPPEREYEGPAFEALVNVSGARLEGIHLRLPGYGDDGPTLEIFEYDPAREQTEPVTNRLGYAHIAFEVDDVPAAREAVLEAGGAALGEIVTLEIASGDRITVCYMSDPEGNILELQSWSRA